MKALAKERQRILSKVEWLVSFRDAMGTYGSTLEERLQWRESSEEGLSKWVGFP